MKSPGASFEEISSFEKRAFESMVVHKPIDYDYLRQEVLPKYLLMMKSFKK